MRITGGNARGIPLIAPKGDLVRPATDALRQAVFSSLAGRVEGVHFLDLFAGTGSYGLEALSRGAAGGTFIERNPKAVACLRQNLTAVCKSLARDSADVSVFTLDATTAPLARGVVPELVFIDPPYEIISEVAALLFARLTEALATAVDPVVSFEMPGELELAPVGWQCVKRLGKGVRQPTVAFFRRV